MIKTHEQRKFYQIIPIKYSCCLKDLNNNVDNTKYNCSNITNNLDLPQIVVNIDPNKFTDNVISPLDHTNKKWFINLTNAIPSVQFVTIGRQL